MIQAQIQLWEHSNDGFTCFNGFLFTITPRMNILCRNQMVM